MLSALRAFSKSWIAWLLIVLLIVSFAVFGASDVFRGGMKDAVVEAGPRTVSRAEFRQEFDNVRRSAEQQYGQPISNEQAVEAGLDNRLIQEIAAREAFGVELRKAGIHPSDNQLKRQLQQIPAFFNQVSGKFDKALYQQRLAENGLTPTVFEARLADDVAQNHFATAVVNGFKAPRAYSALGAVYELESRDVAAFAITPGQVARPAAPTDAQLTAFMKENAAQLTRPEQRVLTVVRFSPALVSGPLTVSEADVQKRFEFRKDTLSQPETRSLVQIPAKDAATAQAIAQRLAKGEAPAAVARSLGVDAITYEDKPLTAIADRKVGEAAFRLKAGEVSGPIQGELGFAVVKVSKVTPGRTVTLEEVRPQIEAELRKDAAGEKVYAISQAYDDAHAGGASLKEAAAKAGAPVFTLGPVDQQGRGPRGEPVQGVSAKLLETAFALASGAESEIQEAGEGEYFAVRVDRVIPASLPPLAEVRPQLTQAWLMRELVKRMQTRADELAERVRKGESMEAVAASAGSRVVRSVSLDRSNAGSNQTLSREILIAAFGAKSGEVFTARGNQFEILVGKLEAIRPPSGPNLARITEGARQQMGMGLFREFGESAQRGARDLVKVKTHEDQARLALGLEPVATSADKDGKAAEKAK